MRKPGKPAKKYSQAARLHDVIRILRARFGATVDELAEECQVTRRTVYRDLKALEEAGYPLTGEPQADGRVLHRFMPEFKEFLPVTFSLHELMTLYFCRGQLAFLQGTPFQDDLDAIFARIRSNLSPRNVAHLERLAQTASPRFLGLRDYQGQRAVLETLRDALLRQYRCRVLYAPARREPEEYLFDPYTLLFFKDSLYLAGWAHNRNDYRLFLVDRIHGVDRLEQRFEVPDDFSAADLTGSAFGLINEEPMRIRVRFAAEVAYLVRERTWHPSQEMSEEADGALVLSFEAGGEKEILSWLYSYIPHVRVLEPASLRQAFADGLRQTLVDE
ncbi:MAG: transcriptional regulator [Desulfuromonadaceae bacterium GWC2_58_13]|nr:MAG: transcriptional regulator [Desulfuromonadaceae bacterium GWC2_58_13]